MTTSPHIVIANRIHRAVAAVLEPHGTLDVNDTGAPWNASELRERCRNADAIMAFMTERVDAAFLDACPKLRVIAGALKGYNNFDLFACTQRGIAVTVVPDLLTEPTAELTLGLMIAVARHFGAGDRLIRAGRFEGWRPIGFGGSLDGAIIGILGAGAVGQALLRMLSGFNCQRQYFDTHRLTQEAEQGLQAAFVDQETLVRTSDFLVVGLHLTSNNRHLVDTGFIESMKPGAYLINPSRGSLVDEAAVADALETGGLAGYAADTFELEDWQLDDRPRQVDARLRTSDKTFFTPHLGSAVRRVREAIEAAAAASIIDVFEGRRPDGLVNEEVFD